MPSSCGGLLHADLHHLVERVDDARQEADLDLVLGGGGTRRGPSLPRQRRARTTLISWPFSSSRLDFSRSAELRRNPSGDVIQVSNPAQSSALAHSQPRRHPFIRPRERGRPRMHRRQSGPDAWLTAISRLLIGARPRCPPADANIDRVRGGAWNPRCRGEGSPRRVQFSIHGVRGERASASTGRGSRQPPS